MQSPRTTGVPVEHHQCLMVLPWWCSNVFLPCLLSENSSHLGVPFTSSWKFSRSFSHVLPLLTFRFSVVLTVLVISFSSSLQWIFFPDKTCVPGHQRHASCRPTKVHYSRWCHTPLAAPPLALTGPPTLSTDTVDAVPLLFCPWPQGSKAKPEHTPGSS